MAYIRVNKAKARHLYNCGVTISLLPCNVPYLVGATNMWVSPVEISRETSPHTQNHFDRTVNEFECLTCCAQLGYYAHYYVDKEKYEEMEEKLNGTIKNTRKER